MFEKVKGFASKVVDKVNGKVLACANAAVLAPTVLTVAANAEEPALSSSATVSGLVGATSDVVSVINVVMNAIFGNPILLFFFGGSAVLFGIKMFKAIKRTAKS